MASLLPLLVIRLPFPRKTDIVLYIWFIDYMLDPNSNPATQLLSHHWFDGVIEFILQVNHNNDGVL